jgi:hypothetical protein
MKIILQEGVSEGVRDGATEKNKIQNHICRSKCEHIFSDLPEAVFR